MTATHKLARSAVPRGGTRLFCLMGIALAQASCQAAPPTATPTSPSATARAPTASSTPSRTPTPTAAASPRPTESPPAGFTTAELRPDVEAASYLPDACAYLALRWDPAGSPPGTVVLPVMYHSVRTPQNMPNDNVTVSTDYFQATVDAALQLGFETITAGELLGFLTENARIPERSMLLIFDDRYPGALAEYVLPAIEARDWTVTLGWIIGDTGPSLWATIENLAAGGRLDVQAHGLRHLPIGEWMSDEEIRSETAGPIPILEEHFGKRPIAFVWPGGNFTRRSVEIARQEGYRLGFTAYSRGPLLFNWIPQGPEEQAVGDPLMLLPRAWSPSAIVGLEQAARIAEAAASAARAAWPNEAAWYRANCGGSLPSP